MEHTIVIGVDIGGSHITAAQVHMGHRQMVPGTEVRHPVDPHGQVDAIISAWSQCILTTAGDKTPDQVCIAMPGPFDYEQGICLIKDQHKYRALFGLNVKELLAQQLSLSTSQLFLHNDAACFLQGEVFGGSMTGYHPVIGITLGTGLGSATCTNTVAQDAGWWAYPFQEKMAEDYLSTRWFVQRWRQMTGQQIQGVKELVSRAQEGEQVQNLFDEFADNLTAVLRAFIQEESPEAVVIGGNIANAWPLFNKRLLQQVQATHPAIIIKISQLGETAALLGAAGSWQACNHLLHH
jgi:glucokinase